MLLDVWSKKGPIMSTILQALSLDHVNMTVKDLMESVAFYKDLFGFVEKKDQPEDRSKIIGNETIKLCLYEDPELIIGAGLNHFGFHVENFEDIVIKCEAMGIPMPYGVVNWELSRSVYIVDPNGYEVELSELDGGGL
jgi:catechol 2,3-dioxygenase-like lactoylglutathione lyase family enzyme